MADTIREKIVKNLKTTLEGITTANGYNNEVGSVQRWDKRGNETAQQNITIVIYPGPETKLPQPNPLFSCRLPLMLEVWVIQDEDDTLSTDERLNSILGDIEKALMVDIKRGGNAEDTDINGNEQFLTIEGQPNAGLTVDIEVKYRHKQTDPEQIG